MSPSPRAAFDLCALLPLTFVSATACSPVVDLGSTATDAAASSTTRPAASTDGATETSTGVDDDGATTSVTTAVAGSGTTSTTSETTGASASTGASTGTTGGTCSLEGDGACVTCAERNCCDEVAFCQAQPMCSCFLTCIETQTPMTCMGLCEFVSGVAAVNACLGMACGAECG